MNQLNHTATYKDINETKNNVLKNTYLLLAISLIPTVIGSYLGLQFTALNAMNPIMSLIIFLAVSTGFIIAIEKNKESKTGVYILLGFTFFMGLMLSRLLGIIITLEHGTTLIMLSFGGTSAIFFVMSSLAHIVKKDLSNMSKFLTAGALLVFIAFIANIFIQSSTLMLAASTLCIGVFSAYLLVEVQRILNKGENNYIIATLGIYLSLYNIFQSILAIFGILNNNN